LTKAPGKDRQGGPLRVIRVRGGGTSDGLELTVCGM
jgi:hypothetical protein